MTTFIYCLGAATFALSIAYGTFYLMDLVEGRK